MAKNKVSKEEFFRRITEISSAKSVTGKTYSQIHINQDRKICTGVREERGESFEIQLEKLFEAYQNLNVINTATLKEYVDRVQSPSFAILKEAGLA